MASTFSAGFQRFLSAVASDDAKVTFYDLSTLQINPAAGQKLADALQKNRHLERLYLVGCYLTDAALLPICKALRKNATLKTLDLSNNKLTAAAANELLITLKWNKTLVELNLNGNSGIPPVLKEKIGGLIFQNELRTNAEYTEEQMNNQDVQSNQEKKTDIIPASVDTESRSVLPPPVSSVSSPLPSSPPATASVSTSFSLMVKLPEIKSLADPEARLVRFPGLEPWETPHRILVQLQSRLEQLDQHLKLPFDALRLLWNGKLLDNQKPFSSIEGFSTSDSSNEKVVELLILYSSAITVESAETIAKSDTEGSSVDTTKPVDQLVQQLARLLDSSFARYETQMIAAIKSVAANAPQPTSQPAQSERPQFNRLASITGSARPALNRLGTVTDKDKYWEIAGYRLQLNSKIQSSADAVILHGKKLVNQEEVTLKIRTAEHAKASEHEYHVLKALQAPGNQFVVKLLDYIENFDGFGSSAIVMEKGYSNIQESLKLPRFRNNEFQKRSIMKEMVECLQFLHRNDYVWFDCKLTNFVFFEGGSVKMIDFSTAVKQGESIEASAGKATPTHLPPEFARFLLDHQQGKATRFTAEFSFDVWALGVSLFTLYSSDHQPPIEFTGEFQDNLQRLCNESGLIESIPWNQIRVKSSAAEDLFRRMLQFQSRQRIASEDIENSTFFASFAGHTMDLYNFNTGINEVKQQVKDAKSDIINSVLDLAFRDLPSVILILPEQWERKQGQSRVDHWVKVFNYKRLFQEQVRLHVLCEFSILKKAAKSKAESDSSDSADADASNQPTEPEVDYCCHRTEHSGFPLSKPREFVQKLGPFIKGSLLFLSVAARAGRVFGIDIVDELQELSSGIRGFLDSVDHDELEGLPQSSSAPAPCDTNAESSSIPFPQRLDGDALETLRSILCPPDTSTATSAQSALHRVGGLYRVGIRNSSAPVGSGREGEILWVCKDHKALIDEWNQGNVAPNQFIERGIQIADGISKKLQDMNAPAESPREEFEALESASANCFGLFRRSKPKRERRVHPASNH